MLSAIRRTLHSIQLVVFLIAAAAAQATVTPVTVAQDDPLQQQIQRLAEHLNGALVQIEITGFPEGQPPRRTGTLIDREGHLLTHATGLEQAPDTILITNAQGQQQLATWLAVDHVRNLVLLKTEPFPIPALCEPADLTKIQPGQTVVALGKMLDAGQVHVSAGIVSAKGRIWGKATQTDAKVSPLNYGGPLVDLQGRLVGILTPLALNIRQNNEGEQWYDSGVGFAVDIGQIADRLELMKQGLSVSMGLGGFQFRQSNWNSSDFPISSIHPGSPAFGQLKLGDQIVAIDQQPVTCLADFYDRYYQMAAGDLLTVTVERQGLKENVQLKLTDRLLPFQFRFLAAQIQQTATGLEVLAADTGNSLRAGDQLLKIDEQPIGSRSELRQQLIGWPEDQPVNVQVQRADKTLELSVALQNLAPWDWQSQTWLDLPKQPKTTVTTHAIQPAELAQGATLMLPTVEGEGQQTNLNSGAPVVILLRDSLQSSAAVSKQWTDLSDEFQIPILVTEPQEKQWTADDADCLEKMIQQTMVRFPEIQDRPLALLAIGDASKIATLMLLAEDRQWSGLLLFQSPATEPIEKWTNQTEQRLMILSVDEQEPGWLASLKQQRVPAWFLSEDADNRTLMINRWLRALMVE